MNEEKLIKVLKQLTTLSNLQDEKNKIFEDKLKLLKEMSDVQNKTISKLYDRLDELIMAIEKKLETKVCHDEVNQLIEEADLTKSARIT
jgi:hypothetical protein